MQRFTSTPTAAQRQAAQPVLRVASLQRHEEEHLRAQRLPLQRQVAELRASLPASAIQAALQRQASERTPGDIPSHPQAAREWVTVMRHRAEQVDGTRMDARSTQAFATLQRQVAAALVHSVKHDPSPTLQRHTAFAEHAVSLQRHALTRHIPRAALAQLPPGERLSLQRAVDEATRADALQRQQDQQALTLHSLQRHLADLDEQATKPVMERIQARRGSGNPLPASVQRHLERGLNHDLSAVRIHDDAEADKLAKGVNATAFTTGTDIYFRSGKFNPNTQSGLELLAHEVTHTVQQGQGKVGKGIDPDPGLENEARGMGKKLAAMVPSLKRPILKADRLPIVGALQRSPSGNVQANPYSTMNAAQKGNFCKPYSPAEVLTGAPSRDYAKAAFGLMFIEKDFGSEVAALWRLYLAGGGKKRVEITPSEFPKTYQAFVKAPTNDNFVWLLENLLPDLIKNHVMPNKTATLDVKKVLKDDLEGLKKIFKYNLGDGIPGNIAGGFESGSDLGKDQRNIAGKITFKYLKPGVFEADIDLKIEVLDAIDLCPGDPGTGREQLLTIPLSRLEKAGVAGDVGFRVVYPIRAKKLVKV
ncbi:eCIS core domain-containing protein [Deinococcus ficus]|uniref:eCIS core domain-containing protein n=1 Tax=Deinococcus ficus TaxID=317577 RepID=UPI001F1F9CCA|nr:DUF4157 domain-containing protein [Deinococcus ficus]